MAQAQKQTATSRLRVRYYSYMPTKKRHRVLLWVAFCFLAAVLAVQLAWPVERGLPLASVPGRSLMLASHETMARAVTDQFDATKIKLSVPGKSVEYRIKSAGAEPNTEDMIAEMSDYPLWQRLIPGSILRPAQVMEASVFYTNAPLQTFADKASGELSFAPKNARLAIEEGRLVAADERNGSKVAGGDVLRAMNQATLQLGKTTEVKIPAEQLPPARTAKDLEKVRTHAETALAHTLVLMAAGQRFSPSKEQLASWIVLSTAADGDVTLKVDKGKIRDYLDELNKKVGTPAGQTDIRIVDGREVSRTTGATGRAIDYGAVTSRIAKALLVPPPEIAITAPMVDVKPSVIFNSRYTTTQAGLQAYVSDVARTRNMHIVIQQLDGKKWRAAAREHESIPSASTYKLFVSLVLFDKINKGEIHWSDPMLDTDAAECFDRMTVASTNPCAEKWMAMFSRQYINNFIYARGFSRGTSFTTGSATQTTAADLNKFMIGLNDGTLVSGANRDRLLNNLGRHPYRYGIPTGSAGRVNDKVGFLWDYVHDTAIVHHPRGTYVMTIMTKGQSYAAIAAVTREVERIMYP